MTPLFYNPPKPNPTIQRTISFGVALVLHVFLLLLGSAVFAQTAQYGIETGMGGIEVHMIAALPQEQALKEIPLETPDQKIINPEMQMPEHKQTEKIKAKSEEKIIGDGSSSVPGKDSTTLHTAAGVETVAKPNYLRNDPPRYPYEARQNKQEGVVLLFVDVSEKGKANKVTIRKSSGFPLLDKSAYEAVSSWKFLPAKVGSMAVESQVEVPVRFRLADAE
jgi:protein TonB